MQHAPPPPSNPSSAAAPASNPAAHAFTGPWSREEEDALVRAHNAVGARRLQVEGWAPVLEAMVNLGFQRRVWDAVRTHHRMLEERAEAQGVPLTGSIPLPPWTIDEDATILAIDSILEESSATLGRTRPIVWAEYVHLFPGRGMLDLQHRRKRLKNIVKLKNTPEYAAALTKMDEKKREIEQKKPPMDEPRPPSPPRPAEAPSSCSTQTPFTAPSLLEQPSYPILRRQSAPSLPVQRSDPHLYSLSGAPAISPDLILSPSFPRRSSTSSLIGPPLPAGQAIQLPPPPQPFQLPPQASFPRQGPHLCVPPQPPVLPPYSGPAPHLPPRPPPALTSFSFPPPAAARRTQGPPILLRGFPTSSSRDIGTIEARGSTTPRRNAEQGQAREIGDGRRPSVLAGLKR